jgi:hypothetical protein
MGWNGTQTVNLRVLSVDHQAGSITVGQDVYGTGSTRRSSFATTTGTSFTVHKRQWFAGRYEGLDTGTQDASIPGELHYEICNPVMNITGAPGAMYEFNLNVYADTADYCRALFITGSGDAHNDKLIGIDLQRGGKVRGLPLFLSEMQLSACSPMHSSLSRLTRNTPISVQMLLKKLGVEFISTTYLARKVHFLKAHSLQIQAMQFGCSARQILPQAEHS